MTSLLVSPQPDASKNTLQSWFPHTTPPFISSAPMRLIAGPEMVVEMTKNGGFGFLAAGYHFPNLDQELTEIRSSLGDLVKENEPLPIGVGFITHTTSFSLAFPIITKHKVKAVWISFPSNSSQHNEWITCLHSAGESWGLKVFVQVGSVATAKEAVEMGCDALVVQGSDAGGHGWKDGASLITLLPEVADTVKVIGIGKAIPLIAAGGLMDGRGVAGALALGAQGVTMGTKFITSTESLAHPSYKSALVNTFDGGQTTTRTHLYDNLRGTRKDWPDLYDGRAIKNESWVDDLAGVPEADNKLKYEKAVKENDYGRLTTFAGTGVGMIRDVEGCGEIVRKTQKEAVDIMRSLSGF